MSRARLLGSLAFIVTALAVPAQAARAPMPNGSQAQLADWLSGRFHPAAAHQTLIGGRVRRLDRPGELMVRMDLTDEDAHARDFWFYGVARGPKGTLLVRQYWVTGDDRATYATVSPARDRLVRAEGCVLTLRPTKGGAYQGRVDPRACRREVEGRLFRIDRELSVTYNAVTPTVRRAAAFKRAHPSDTGTEMYFRSEH
jgi:hypothetical protein